MIIYFATPFIQTTTTRLLERGQIEYAFPEAEDRRVDQDHWLEVWLEGLRRLGILDDDHRVEEFDFKTRLMHFNGFGMEGEPLRDADPSLLRADTNIRPVTPSMANFNLNIHVPRSIRFVASVLAESGVATG